ncbi:UPF0561 protein C2orf68 homolog isoform X1 [Micropterus dolomieu]|uniref:UPF0561 protein C2orf68 homolog isoform X1 n=1 Tax=Micropterus dolomieu TaxID=147949 RepID=UPI001E8EEFF8|nr:UPF0561 protein C2orf68 homolog isoform X1 [Micropterus dolomieu]
MGQAPCTSRPRNSRRLYGCMSQLPNSRLKPNPEFEANARDDYDKEVKQAKELQRRRHTTTPRRPRRPDIQVYLPRRRYGSEPGAGAEAEEWNESGSSTETETHGTELFWLDYQADSGTITSFLVHKEDKPEKVVERVATKNILDSAMRAALEARIRKEMDKRRDKR